MEAKHNKELEYQNAYICGDCLDVLRGVPDNSIDLIMTSPPYADQIKDYGDVVKKIKPDDYIEWFLQRAQEFLRVLKPEGSFISDKVVDNYQHLYVFELLLKLCKGKTMRQIIMPSDVVLHRPTGETWTVCGVDHKAGRLIPCGYPFPTVARIEDCEVIERHYETQYQTEEQIKALRKHGLTSFIDVKSAMFHGLI